MTVSDGPYPLYTLIYCRGDGFGWAVRAAFGDAGEAREHARQGLQRRGAEWVSAVVARGDEADLDFLGAWDRHPSGDLSWEAASLA